MIKRILACLLVLAMVPTCLAFAEISFPDLPDSHWAHADVAKMVADGRVNGFPDGEFKPNENVTRWQFVKMMGGSDPDATSEPHRPATRGEACEFLWEKAGKPAAIAPSAVAVNTAVKDAAVWAYSVGIMNGDDGFNLRLDSTLTRAEAAALIIRSESGEKKANNFIDTVDPKILKKVWDAFGTGIEYDENRTISNGELSIIAVRYGYERRNPIYKTLLKNPEFEAEYAKAMQLVAQECLGEDKANKEFHDADATMQDMVTVLGFYAMKPAASSISYSPAKNYLDAKEPANRFAEMGIKFARHNGVFLYAEDKIDAERTATLKDVACVLLQLDEIVGLHQSAGVEKPLKIRKSLYGYPENAADYAYIVADVPASVYAEALIDGAKPADTYDFANDLKDNFVSFLKRFSYNIPVGVKLEWTFIPSLVAESETDLVVRAGLKILENPNGLSLNEIFAKNTLSETITGDSFYVDISVGTPFVDLTISTEKAKLTKAIIG